MAFAESANLLVKLSLGGNFQSQLSKATRQLKGFDRDATRAYKAGAQIGTGIRRGAIVAAGGLTVLAGVIAKSVGAAGDFEAQLNTINTIARETPEVLGKIGDSIRQVAKDTGTPLEDLTQGYYDLLSAGIKAADAQNVLTQANKLAIGGLSTTAESIDLLTSAINVYGGDAKQAGRDTDIFAKAIERGKVTAAEIASSFSTVGPLAAAYGISIDEIGAAYARLTASGQSAGEAATQMRSAIQSLAKPDKALKTLEGKFNKNYLAIAGKKGLVVALQQMRTDAKKAGIPLSLLTSRIEAMQFLLQTTGPNFDAYNADLKAMGDASGTAADQMAERQQGLNFQLDRLKALAKDAGITIGSALLPKLTPVVAALNKFITDNQGKIADFGAELAKGFTAQGVIDGIKGITGALGPMVDLIKISAAPVKAIVNAFLALPKEVQTVLIGAFAVNKLTGGLVTNVFGGIAEAIAKAVIRAPLVNVSGAVVNVSGGIGGGTDVVPNGSKSAIKQTIKEAFDIVKTIALPIGAGIAGGTLVANSQAGVFNQPGSDPKVINDAVKAGLIAYNGRVFQQVKAAIAQNKAGDDKNALMQEQELKRTATILAARLEANKAQGQRTAAAVKDADSSIDVGTRGTTAATRAGSAAITAAIYASRPSISVDVRIAATTISKTVNVSTRYGSTSGSRDKNNGSGLGPGSA